MTSYEPPSDQEFAAYWDQVDADLAALPARPVLERVPGRCTRDFTGYEVWLTSVGPYRIFGYLSVPTGAGPFPGLLTTPRYGSVNNPPHYNDRLRYVSLTIMHRGQRRADSPFAATYPGLLTEGIDDAPSYVYRGIVADCLRAAEFLTQLPEVDPTRVGVVGDDLAMITAARRPFFTAVDVSGALLYGAGEARKASAEYPLEELNDYLRAYPDKEGAVARTLAFFDAERHVPNVRCPVRLEVPESAGEPSRLAMLAVLVGGEVTRYVPTLEGQTDADAADQWLAKCLGVPAMSKFERNLV